jgi:hypothetical protein
MGNHSQQQQAGDMTYACNMRWTLNQGGWHSEAPTVPQNTHLCKWWNSHMFLKFKSSDIPATIYSLSPDLCPECLQHCPLHEKRKAQLSLAAVSTTPWRHGAVEIELLVLVTLALYGWSHALATLAKPRSSQYPLHMSPGGAQCSSEQDYKEKYLCPCEELNPHSSDPSLVVNTKLSPWPSCLCQLIRIQLTY